jgi:hypothetical protein
MVFGVLNNGYYDALLPVEEKDGLGIFNEVGYYRQSLPEIYRIDSCTTQSIFCNVKFSIFVQI